LTEARKELPASSEQRLLCYSCSGDITERSSEARSPISSARDTEFGQTATGERERAPTTSRLASHRSYVSRDSAFDDHRCEPVDPKELILRSLLALAPVTYDGGGEDTLQCSQVHPLIPYQYSISLIYIIIITGLGFKGVRP
jgi:hypothetical protein